MFWIPILGLPAGIKMDIPTLSRRVNLLKLSKLLRLSFSVYKMGIRTVLISSFVMRFK